MSLISDGNIPPFLSAIAGRWSMSFMGAVMAGALIWFLGELVPGLRTPAARIICVIIVLIIWAGVNSLLSWRARHKDKTLMAGATEGDNSDDAMAAQAEAQEEARNLRERLQKSLQILKKTRKGRGYLYEQPWFVLIGPPGSGKTTLLTQSGLRFPLAQPDGIGGLAPGAVAGIGGTRLCDWWFADEAVLIDTAGRFTTQDSNETVDRSGWLNFLGLLKRTRSRQPLNGVIVMISLADVVTVSQSERLFHARMIRDRIRELTERLGVRIPVYAIFTKADRIAGFTEFFDDLDRDYRRQVWGMTFQLQHGIEDFTNEFHLLTNRLNDRLFERLQQERIPARRAIIASFPLQMETLNDALNEFLNAAFGSTRLDPAPFIRGIYFTSSAQEGTPVDRLSSMLARSFGIDQRRMPALRSDTKRAYFVERLLSEVILGEARLVSSSPTRQRRRLMLRRSGFAAVALVTVLSCIFLWQRNIENRQIIAHNEDAINIYRSKLENLHLDPVADDNLPAVLPALNAARALPDARTLASRHRVWPGMAFNEDADIGMTNHLIYQAALQRLLLPRLMWRLENQIQEHFSQPAFLYEATRIYLMLSNQGSLEPEMIRDWMLLDWESRFPGPSAKIQRDQLMEHLNALLETPLPSLQVNGGMVKQARAAFSRVSPAERVYGRIRASAMSVPDWSPETALGHGQKQFTRLSGRPMTDTIPGFYTSAGFRQILLPALPSAAQDVASESWVLGSSDHSLNGTTPASLENGVLDLYTADYIRHWDDMLNDLALVPFSGHSDLVQRLYVLSSPQSPMRDFLVAITHELTPATDAQNEQRGEDKQKADPEKSRLGAFFNRSKGSNPAAPVPGTEIDLHFAPLVIFTGRTGQAPPINGVMQILNQFEGAIAQLPNADNPAQLLQSTQNPVQSIQAESLRQPQPVSRWLNQIATAGDSTMAGDAKRTAAAAYSSAQGPAQLCMAVVKNHYPFDPNAEQDAPLDQFIRLFTPGGVLDTYFTTQLAAYVDTKGPVWRAHNLGNTPPPVSAAALAQFQQAARIRSLLFPGNMAVPAIHLHITPLAADPLSKIVNFRFGSLNVVWKAGVNGTLGQALGASMTWPGDNISNIALDFVPEAAFPRRQQGSWAFFHLLDSGVITPTGKPDHLDITFRSGDRSVTYDLETSTPEQVFDHTLFSHFHCPILQ